MTAPVQLVTLQEEIQTFFPKARVVYDPSATDSGSSWLDVYLRDIHMVVEYRKASGFGVSVAGPGFGQGADEVFSTREEAAARLHQVLRSELVRGVK